MKDLRYLFDEELRKHGYSLSAAARALPWDKGNLSAVRSGRKPLTANLAAKLDKFFGTQTFTALLEGPPGVPDSVLREAHEWLVGLGPAPAGRHRAVGDRVGASLVAELDQRVIDLRLADDTHPSRHLAPVLLADLAEVQTVLDECSYTHHTGRDLLRIVGELAQLAGWTLSDLGAYARAERLYLDGAAAATEAGDRALAAQNYSCLAYQVATAGGDGLLLAQTAALGTVDAPPLVRTLVLERVAWAAARARRADVARRALDQVQEVFALRGTVAAEPHWTYWVDNASEIDVMAGRVHIELGSPDQAAPLIQNAIADYPAEHEREAALYRAYLALAYARSGNLDAARAWLEGTGPAAGSDRIARLIAETNHHLTRGLSKQHERPCQREPAVPHSSTS